MGFARQAGPESAGGRLRTVHEQDFCFLIQETQGKVNREEGENSKAQKGIKIVIMNEKNNDEIIINTSEHIGQRDDKGNITYSEVNNQEIKR